MSSNTTGNSAGSAPGFSDLNLPSQILHAVQDLGYESTLPIQSACIPPMLEGRDVLGLAQTGTGKTAAFALPLLATIDLSLHSPQVLVLTPTRELAIQVAEAFQAFARHLKGFHVLPIYGGQRYSFQFNQLRRGPQVIVGTPGRIQDHLNRRTLDLSGIQCLVLDEADEMLRMGFVEDVEAIMALTPPGRQTALFSATMPSPIKRLIKGYLKDPFEIRIEAKTVTADNIEQMYLVVPASAKFEALVRLLETESYDGILVFARTRLATTEISEKLSARGFDVAALNGDLNQSARERTIKRLKNGNVDIVVATDVAARGLDVDRISLVINYDIPGDSEAYIHRIGRTGRAGRSGKAILFAGPRERHILKSIERVTRQTLHPMELPGHDEVTSKRVEKFSKSLEEIMAQQRQDFFENLAFEMMEKLNVDILQLAAGALCLAQVDKPLRADRSNALTQGKFEERPPAKRGRDSRQGRAQANFVLFRLEVGSQDGVEVRNIVGAIANETGLRSRFIGQIRIHPMYSTVELPGDVPQHVIEHLRTTYVAGKPMKISRSRGGSAFPSGQKDEPRARKSTPRPPRAKGGIGKKSKKGKRKPRPGKPGGGGK